MPLIPSAARSSTHTAPAGYEASDTTNMAQNEGMSGTFKVVGTFRLKNVGLVVYGDVVTGSVSNGELLLIPLNSSLSVTAPIRSVEAIDGTATGSHVALVLTADGELEISVLEALQFAGEVLHVERTPDEASGPTSE